MAEHRPCGPALVDSGPDSTRTPIPGPVILCQVVTVGVGSTRRISARRTRIMAELNGCALVLWTIPAHLRNGQSPAAESTNEIVFTGSWGFCRQGIDSITGSPGVDRGDPRCRAHRAGFEKHTGLGQPCAARRALHPDT
jgi:hypothetical protein